MDAGGQLIRQLKRQALEYEETGIDPSLMDFLSSTALPYYPGIERQVRLKELKKLAKMTFADLLSLQKGEGGEEEGEALSLSVKTCNAVIKAKAYEGDLEGAVEFYEKMVQCSLVPDEETFVHLIHGASKRKDAAAARLLFLKMRSCSHIVPTNRVYSSLVQAHLASGDLSSAFALVRKMEDEQIAPDCVVYTALIDGLIKHRKIKKAWRLFWSVRTWKKIEPDEVLFTVMIKACAVKGEAERALNLLDDLRASGLYPTDITYMEVIHACCDRKDFAFKCFEFFNQMKAEDMPLSLPVYTFLLRVRRRVGIVLTVAGATKDTSLSLIHEKESSHPPLSDFCGGVGKLFFPHFLPGHLNAGSTRPWIFSFFRVRVRVDLHVCLAIHRWRRALCRTA